MDTNGSLKQKALRGVMWSAIDKVGARMARFLVSIIVARILMPSDYGIIGMLLIFMALSNLLLDSGIGQALVQKKDRTQTDFSTAFYFNIFIGFVCYIILFFAAPLVARFYNVPVLVPVLRVFSIGLVLNSLCIVQRARLMINIDFKTMTIINFSGVLISGAVGIWTAYKGLGVWALVYQQLAYQTVSVLLLWFLGKWIPAVEFSKESFKHLYRFGVNLLVAGGVATIMREIYSIVIGKVYHATELGYYSKSVGLTDTVSGTVNEIINSVTFPILASIQHERERMVAAYSNMLSMTAFFIFPAMTLMALLAPFFVKVVLTEKWVVAIPLIQWLCFARMFTPISSLNMNILNAIGRSDLFLKLDLSKLPLSIITMVITLPIGVNAVVIGNFICTFICYFINAYLPGKYFGFGVTAQFRIFYKKIISTLIMAGCVIFIVYLINNDILKLIIGSIVALASYYAVSFLLKVPEVKEVNAVLLKIVKH